MVSRKVDDGDMFRFRANGADAGRVSEVDDKPKAFEGCVFKETVIPRLRIGSAQFGVVWDTRHT